MRTVSWSLAWVAIAAASCTSSGADPHTGPSGAPTGASQPTATAAATPAPTSAPPVATVQSGHIRGEMREGASCASIGKHVPPAGVLSVDGKNVVQSFKTGCGCPTGPHYTLLYEPKTSPLRVRLCEGPGKDPCEALCQGSLRWDMTPQMAQAGASTIELVAP